MLNKPQFCITYVPLSDAATIVMMNFHPFPEHLTVIEKESGCNKAQVLWDSSDNSVSGVMEDDDRAKIRAEKPISNK